MAQALDAEIDRFISQYDELKDNHGRQRIFRSGYLPGRTVQSDKRYVYFWANGIYCNVRIDNK